MSAKFQRHSPQVLEAVVGALAKAYWFKRDLRSFLLRAGVPEGLVNRQDWSQQGPVKWTIARAIVDTLASNPGSGTETIERIIDALVEQDSFDQFRNVEDRERKVEEAQAAIERLRNLFNKETLATRVERARSEARTESQYQTELAAQRTAALAGLNKRFGNLSLMTDRNERGRLFEPFLRELFAIHDLNPRGSFSSPGEQTDGSIQVDGTILLVEAKWTQGRIETDDVRNFRAKVEDKLDSTLGLFVSMSGFTEEAIARAQQGRRVLVLMEGVELAHVLQGMNDLRLILRQKLRCASETGRVLFRPGLDT